jgi:hypothetical protein
MALMSLSVFNTTATAVSLKLVRVTTAGTQGTAQSRMPLDAADAASNGIVYTTHTVAPTITSGDLYRFLLGASIGSGVVLSFQANPIIIPATANNGLALVVSTGTGQICEVTWGWSE